VLRERLQVLHDSSEVELVARTTEASQAHALKAMMGLEMREAHLQCGHDETAYSAASLAETMATRRCCSRATAIAFIGVTDGLSQWDRGTLCMSAYCVRMDLRRNVALP
jgi:hypothetical protein